MLKTALKLIFRNWWRNKTFMLISVISLTVGIACTALLISFVKYEYGIEKNNPNLDQMVWVMQNTPPNTGGGWAHVYRDVAAQIKQNYPEVEDLLQIDWLWISYVEVNNQKFNPPLIFNVDVSFPHFFPFELLYGSWKALEDPLSIIITDEQAKRFFGNENALGKQIGLKIDFSEASEEITFFTVGGVVKKRAQSAIKIDGFFCNQAARKEGGYTLLKVPPKTNLQQFEQKVREDGISIKGEQYYFYSFSDAISSHYLGDTRYWYSRKDALLLTGLISAVLVFLIAIFNYVNMSFSRILQQVKTLHTEKLMGAKSSDVHLQIFLDTFLTVSISFMLAILMMHDMLPIFIQIVGVNFTASYFYSSDFFPLLILLALLLTIIPAWIMSRKISRLSATDYRLFFVTKKNRWIASMVTIQFVIAFALIIAAITANRQVDMVKKSIDRYKDVIGVEYRFSQNSIVDFESRLKTIPGIDNYAFTSGGVVSTFTIGANILKKNGESQQSGIMLISGGDGLIETLKLDQIAGVQWDDAKEKYPVPVFVNKSFIDIAEISPSEIIGTSLYSHIDGYHDTLSVIAGVVEDFYLYSLEREASPVLIKYTDKTEYYDHIYIRVKSGEIKEVAGLLRQAWIKTYPDEFFSYTLVYDYFKKNNSKIFEMSHLLQMYSIISLLLICFGLFGITFYAINQRTKEIGIRKINGAKPYQILWLILKPIFIWLIIGFVIGVPLAWWLMERWLQQFAYRIDISFVSCLIALAIVTMVSTITVIWHTWRMASTNPVKSLQSE